MFRSLVQPYSFCAYIYYATFRKVVAIRYLVKSIFPVVVSDIVGCFLKAHKMQVDLAPPRIGFC